MSKLGNDTPPRFQFWTSCGLRQTTIRRGRHINTGGNLVLFLNCLDPFPCSSIDPTLKITLMQSSMITSLPNEIHLEIFHALNNINSNSSINARIVSQVCRGWRRLSLSMSTLWTHIVISETSVDPRINFDDPYTVDEAQGSSVFPWVSTLLRRSGSRAIDISIDLQFEQRFPPTMSKDMNQSHFPWRLSHSLLLSRILAVNAHRIRTFEICSNKWQSIQGLEASLIDVPMPLLKSWTMTQENAQWGHVFHSDLESDTAMPAIECAPGVEPSAELGAKMYPNLRILTLQGTFQNWAQLIPRHLVELNLEYLPVNRRPTYNQLRALLLGNQSTLESLTLWDATPFAGEQGKIVLPKLQTLSLGFSFLDAAISLTTYLELPSLTNLEIHDMTKHNISNFINAQAYRWTLLLLGDLYLRMINHWPVKQITHLILRSPFFELPEYDRFDEACLQQRGDKVPIPILLEFLFNCSSLKELHLIDPDQASLRALVTVSPVDHKNSPGPFLVCSSLDLLRIEISSMFSPLKHGLLTDRKHDRVTPREIETVELEICNERDEALWPALSGLNKARKVSVNGHELQL
ncbi:hypothetical protein C8R42DRAFT_465014 [Lentinula raphanica]|nr:hypothetical protein C8R42DRAFT_465014 [Lentinula raphanica]